MKQILTLFFALIFYICVYAGEPNKLDNNHEGLQDYKDTHIGDRNVSFKDVNISSFPLQFVNITIQGKIETHIDTLYYQLICKTKHGSWFAILDTIIACDIITPGIIDISFTDSIYIDSIYTDSTEYKSVLYLDDHNCNLDAISAHVAFVTDMKNQFKRESIDVCTYVQNVEDKFGFKIENGVVTSTGEIVVYNILGQLVAIGRQHFDVSILPCGVYCINTQEYTIKFIKIHSK